MSSPPNSNSGFPALKVLAVVIGVIVAVLWHRGSPERSFHVSRSVNTPVRNPIDEALRPRVGVSPREGIGVAILVDTSGSMKDEVASSAGRSMPKIQIARTCLMRLVSQADTFSRAHADRPLQLGIYEFSARRDMDNCRPIVPLGPPDVAKASAAVARMVPEGSTPIGDAIIAAKQDLDRSGLSRTHILVITDGENNHGYGLADVVSGISRLPESSRPAVYLVAFDVAESIFAPVRDAGGLVLAANDQPQLQQTLDYVLTGKILAEQPAGPGQ